MKLKDFFTDKSKWTQGAYARDKHDHMRLTSSPNAVKYCLMGAVMNFYQSRDQQRTIDAIAREVKDNIADWNDAKQRTFEDIKVLIEKLDI